MNARLESRISLGLTTAVLLVAGLPVWAQPPATAPPTKPPIPAGLRTKITGLVDSVVEPELELKVGVRRSKIIRMKRDVTRVSVADPSVVQFVAFGPREIELIGQSTGTTTMTLWLAPDADGPEPLVPGGAAAGDVEPIIVSMLITVTRDEGIEDLRRLEYGELQRMINEMFPNSKVQLIPVADKVIVRGQARDEEEAMQILSLIRAGGGQQGPNGQFGGFAGFNAGAAAQPFPDAAQLPDSNILNLLTVPGEKQVMLKVRIAEISRSAFRRLGVDFDFNLGDISFSNALGVSGNLITSGTFSNGNAFNLQIDALEGNGTGKILAEPNVVVLSGQTATFLSGGSFAVPTVVGVGGAQAATTTFENFGTQLTFTPTVLDKDRIRLQVAPSFSTLNSSNSVQGIPGIDARSVTTTVDLREGQVFAIAGLIQEQQRGDATGLPVVRYVPWLRQLFSARSISRDETELMIVITPELVHPLEAEDAPSILPGMDVTEPDDYEFYHHAQIEGCDDCHHRSTVWYRYKSRLLHHRRDYETYRIAEDHYVFGPHGFSQ